MKEIVRKVNTIKEIKQKIEGFKMLFDKEPQITITGYLRVHEKNESYSYNFSNDLVTKVLTNYLIVNNKKCSIDDNMLKFYSVFISLE